MIVASERALNRNERCVTADLNRVFPGDPTAETHERRLAAETPAAVGDTTVSDRSSGETARTSDAWTGVSGSLSGVSARWSRTSRSTRR